MRQTSQYPSCGIRACRKWQHCCYNYGWIDNSNSNEQVNTLVDNLFGSAGNQFRMQTCPNDCSFGTDTYPIQLDDVSCSTNTYLVILQCSYSTIITSNCVNGRDDASVICCEWLLLIQKCMTLWVYQCHHPITPEMLMWQLLKWGS